jgi:hypothetical protein
MEKLGVTFDAAWLEACIVAGSCCRAYRARVLDPSAA